jgi:hypothetical protein
MLSRIPQSIGQMELKLHCEMRGRLSDMQRHELRNSTKQLIGVAMSIGDAAVHGEYRKLAGKNA